MRREILFKGKRVNWRELPKEEWWVKGYLWVGANFSCITPDNLGIGYNKKSEHVEAFAYEVDRETICEYTGLNDKNGRKIFENDICDRKEEFPEIVTYHDGDWTIDYSYASGKERGYNYCNLGFYVIERGGVEVIGNIFDDPELLGSHLKE